MSGPWLSNRDFQREMAELRAKRERHFRLATRAILTCGLLVGLGIIGLIVFAAFRPEALGGWVGQLLAGMRGAGRG